MKPKVTFFQAKRVLSLVAGLLLGSAFALPSLAAGYTQVYTGQPASQAPYQGYASYQATPRAVSSGLLSPESILARLKAANQVPASIAPHIKISDSPVLNAATDGQNLIITNLLLSKLRTNDQRAFVISHELSHIILQHVTKTQVRHVGLSLLDQILIARGMREGGLGDMATRLGLSLYDKHSSRGYEFQADDLGVKLMSQAGYSPQAAIQVFDILKANTPANRIPTFLQDHPITQDRIRVLAQKYKLQTD